LSALIFVGHAAPSSWTLEYDGMIAPTCSLRTAVTYGDTNRRRNFAELMTSTPWSIG
jgi:hypothetical protein